MNKARLDVINDMYLHQGCRMSMRGGVVLDLLEHIASLETEVQLVRASNALRNMAGAHTQVKSRDMIAKANELKVRRERC